MTTFVKCYNCERDVVKENHTDCPMMFNPGNGPKYCCSECYDLFDSSLLMPAGYRRFEYQRRYQKRANRAPPSSGR